MKSLTIISENSRYSIRVGGYIPLSNEIVIGEIWEQDRGLHVSCLGDWDDESQVVLRTLSRNKYGRVVLVFGKNPNIKWGDINLLAIEKMAEIEIQAEEISALEEKIEALEERLRKSEAKIVSLKRKK